MTNLKKLAALCTAMLLAASLGAFAACDNDDSSSPVQPSDSFSESALESGAEPTSSDSGSESVPEPETCEHDSFGAWETVSLPDCENDGLKIRYCTVDGCNGKEEKYTAKRGHDFGNVGICATCGEGPLFPETDGDIEWKDVSECEGAGEDYNRYEVVEGYYVAEIGVSGEMWLSLSVPTSGQYALYSLENADGVTATRHDASAQYIPVGGDGNYIGFEGSSLEDGNFYSTVNCSNENWSTEWRATWRLKGESGAVVKFRLVRIADTTWRPGYVYEDIRATQLTEKAADTEKNRELTLIPYETAYFLDEETGFYRMGTPDNPGEIIWVAINAPAERQLGQGAFSTIQYEGNNLSLANGYTDDGDYLILNYVPFIMCNNAELTVTGGRVPCDKSVVCYENYTNSDGMYPVNEELYAFLNLFVENNKPLDIPAEIWTNKRENAWLAACYYYKEIIPGTEANPLQLTLGENSVSWAKNAYLYCVYTAEIDCIVSCTDENVVLQIGNNDAVYGPFDVTVKAGETFTLSHATGKAYSTSITVSVA